MLVFEAVPEDVVDAGALPVFALLLIVLMLELLPLALLPDLLVLVTVLPALWLSACCNATTGAEESEWVVDVERDDDEPAAI